MELPTLTEATIVATLTAALTATAIHTIPDHRQPLIEIRNSRAAHWKQVSELGHPEALAAWEAAQPDIDSSFGFFDMILSGASGEVSVSCVTPAAIQQAAGVFSACQPAGTAAAAGDPAAPEN